MAFTTTQSQIIAAAVANAIGNTPASFLTPFVAQPPARQKAAGALMWLQTPQNWTDLVAQLDLAATLETLLGDPKRLSAEMGRDPGAQLAAEHEASTRTRNAAVMNAIEEKAAAELNGAGRGALGGSLDLDLMKEKIPALGMPSKHPASR